MVTILMSYVPLLVIYIEFGKPSVLIADTIKGKGIPEMEDKMEWHYKSPKMPDIEKYMEFLR